jgi:hypothetical protein
MTENIGGDRLLRVCDLCGGVDDHPRHVIAGAMRDVFPRVADEILGEVMANAPDEHRGRLVRELLDTASSDRHRDCCREAGCPTGECDFLTGGGEHLRGADLLEHTIARSALMAEVDSAEGN